jgi:transglutaminase-like putative cysteine protease
LPKGEFLVKKLLVSVLIFISIIASPMAVAAADKPLIDINKVAEGIVTLSYHSDARLKVVVEKDGKQINYDLRNDGTAETFPLQMGNGTYRISIAENITGNKYKYISTKQVELNLDDEKKVFLASIQNINWDNSKSTVKKANEITKGLKSDKDKIKAVYDYITNNIAYDYNKISTLPSTYVPNIDNIITSGKGICYDYASVFAAMLRSQGIPTKLVKGYSKNVSGYHAWNEIYDSEAGKWIIVDTTYDAEQKAAGHAYGMVKETAHYSKVYEY